jgi:hypothetical protein
LGLLNQLEQRRQQGEVGMAASGKGGRAAADFDWETKARQQQRRAGNGELLLAIRSVNEVGVAGVEEVLALGLAQLKNGAAPLHHPHPGPGLVERKALGLAIPVKLLAHKPVTAGDEPAIL